MTHPTNEAAERTMDRRDAAIGYALLETEHLPGFARRGPAFREKLAQAGYRVEREASEAAPSPDPYCVLQELVLLTDRARQWEDQPDTEEWDEAFGRARAVLTKANLRQSGANLAVAPSLLQERDRLAERLYAALWDERVVLDAGIKGFDERRYRAAAKRIVGRLAATSTATEEPTDD